MELLCKPTVQRCEVIGITITSTTKYLIGIGAVIHEYIGTTGYGLTTIAGTIDVCLIATALHHRRFYINIGIARDTAILITAIDGIVHNGILTLVVHTGDVVVAEACSQFRMLVCCEQ